MNIVLADTTVDGRFRDVRAGLVAAGHSVRASNGSPCAVDEDDLLLLLVSSEVDGRTQTDVATMIGTARRVHARVVGLTDAADDALPPAVRAWEVDGGWTQIDRHDLDAVVAAVTSAASAREPVEEQPKKILQLDLGELKRRTRAALAHTPPEPRADLPRLFISYSRKDEKAAAEVIDELQHRGFDVWVDKTNIAGGSLWQQSIADGIRRQDVVLVFLSSNVTAQPKWVVAELAVAQSADKRIIPVELEPMPELPAGIELAISGKQTIRLHQDYDEELRRLLSAIGGPTTSVAPRGALGQAKRIAARAGRAAKRHQLGQKALMVGGALVAGGLTVARARDTAEAQRLSAQQAEARTSYGDQTSALLAEGLAELTRTRDMLENTGQIDVMEFRREVKPRLMRIVGKLEGITPTLTDRDVLDYHHNLVQTFERLIDEFERVLESRDRGDAVGYKYAAQRANDKFLQSLEAALQWARAS